MGISIYASEEARRAYLAQVRAALGLDAPPPSGGASVAASLVIAK